MSSAKYACPFCGQHIEYTEEYRGRQAPCPACQRTILFPGLAAPLMKSTLRLERDIPKPAQKPGSIFARLLSHLRRLMNRKPVAIGLLSLLFAGSALLAYSQFFYRPQTPAPKLAATDINDSIPVDPPDPPPAPPPASIPSDSQPAPVAAATPAPAAPKPARGARGARGGNNAGRQQAAAARGKTPKKAKAPAAATPNQ